MLYAPGIKSLDDLKTVTQNLQKPFNVLAVFIPKATVNEFIEAGAKRISLGGALTWACMKPLLDAGKEMLKQGTFSWTKALEASGEIKRLLQQ